MTDITYRLKAMRGVPAAELVLWLFVFIVWGVLRQKLSEGPIGLELLNRVSTLELAEIYFIVLLARAVPPNVTIGPFATLATLVITATLVVLLRFRPSYASGGLELWLLALSVRILPLRPVALCITLFVFQYVFLAGPFLWLHEVVGRLDASVLRSGLLEIGLEARGAGPIVYLEGSNHGIDVMGACSSSNIVGTITAGYLILVVGRRGHLVADDVLWLTGLLAMTLGVNWLRLGLMAVSKEGHAFWHDGFGASLVALLFAALVIGAAWRAGPEAPRVP